MSDDRSHPAMPAADPPAGDPLGRGLGALMHWLQRAEATVAVVAFAVIVVLLSLDLAGRELLGQGIFVAQRAAVYCMVVAAMLGFSLSIGWGAHMRIELAERIFPRAWSPTVDRISDATAVGACAFLAYWSFRFVAVSFDQQARGMGLEILLWPVQAVFVWAFASGALRHLAYAIRPALRPGLGGARGDDAVEGRQ